MSEFPYWADNWFATSQVKKNFAHLRQRVAQSGVEHSADLRCVLESIDQLETDIGRTLLKLHALVDLLVEKQLVDIAELAAKAVELDTLDGQADGVLHPAIFRTDAEQRRSTSTAVYLQRLEKQTVSPKEFLADLETREPS